MSYTPKHRFFRVFVPASTSSLHGIAPRSAIVAKEPLSIEEGRTLVYYEGNLNGAENLKDLLERLNCAAGRCSERYPTVAMMSIKLSDLVDVGRFDLLTGQLLTLSEPQALLAWLDGEPLPSVGDERFLLKTGGEGEGEETLYWNNADGWGARSSADAFHSSELSRMHLPVPAVLVSLERALPTEGVNPLEAPLRDVLADLGAVRRYASDLIGTDALTDELENHLVGAYADERFQAAVEALEQHATD